eukprot:218521-Rhodomonas_salina.1
MPRHWERLCALIISIRCVLFGARAGRYREGNWAVRGTTEDRTRNLCHTNRVTKAAYGAVHLRGVRRQLLDPDLDETRIRWPLFPVLEHLHSEDEYQLLHPSAMCPRKEVHRLLFAVDFFVRRAIVSADRPGVLLLWHDQCAVHVVSAHSPLLLASGTCCTAPVLTAGMGCA